MLVGLALVPLLGFVPTARATGTGVCTISGTIHFTSSPRTPTEGGWSIEPAVMQCRGVFRGWDRILGPGSFKGSGVYSNPPTGGGTCVPQVGSGTVDYLIPTSEQDVRVIEPQGFLLAGAGSFTTPTLKGTFQVTPPFDGEADCQAKPATEAYFLAEVVMLRLPPRPALTVTAPGAGER